MKMWQSAKNLFRKGAVEILAVSLATALGQIAALIGIVVIGRLYGVAEVGKASLVLALGGVAAGLFDFGTSAAWVRNAASGSLVRAKLAVLLGRKLSYGFLVFATLAGIVYLIYPSDSYYLFSVIAFAITLSQSILVGLRAGSRNFALACVIFFEKLVHLAIFLALSYFSSLSGVASIVISQVISALVAALASAILLGRRGIPKPNFGSASEIWLQDQYFGFSSVAITAQRMDIPLITAAGGDYTAGQYGAVNRWTQPMGLLTQTFSLVVVPYAARANSIRGGLSAVGIAKLLPVGAVFVCLVVFFVAEDVVLIIMGEQFEGSVVVLQVLSVSTALGSLNQPVSALLQAVGQERAVSAVVVTGVTVGLALTFPFTVNFAAPGAAAALLIGQIIMSFGLAVILLKRWSAKGVG